MRSGCAGKQEDARQCRYQKHFSPAIEQRHLYRDSAQEWLGDARDANYQVIAEGGARARGAVVSVGMRCRSGTTIGSWRWCCGPAPG